MEAARAGAAATTRAPQRHAQQQEYQRLIAKHSGALLRLFARVGVPAGDLEDALQDTFVVLLTKQEQICPAAERTYLVATALRLAANRRRGGRRRDCAYANYRHDAWGEGQAPDAEDHANLSSLHEIAGNALSALAPELRDVLMMAELDELRMVEIADQIGIPLGTASSRLRRARRIFEEQVRSGRPLPSGTPPVPTVLFHWWATPEERAALDAMLAVYREKSPDAQVVEAHARGVSPAKSQLDTRMRWAQPPDCFQASAGRDVLDWVRGARDKEGGSRLCPLDDLWAEQGWSDAFPPELVDAISDRGHVYAVPLNIQRTNTLFFHSPTFEQAGLPVPTTTSAFFEVAEELRRRGKVALSLGIHQPWPLTMLAFENLMVSIAGAEYYSRFFAGRATADDPELRQTLEVLKRILTYTNADARSLTWNEAAERMADGSAAMTIGGDWVGGYLNARGSRLGATEPEDAATAGAATWGQVPTFGTEDTFVFSSDVFAMPAAGRRRREVVDLFRAFGSVEGQTAFNLSKGSLPARRDVHASAFDLPALHKMSAFRSRRRVLTLTSLVPRDFITALDLAMGVFAETGDVPWLVKVIRNHYPMLAA
jgi:glucose/mannose transport system substrate-binding protein